MGKLRVEFDLMIDRENPKPETLHEGVHVVVDVAKECAYAEIGELVVNIVDDGVEAVVEESAK